MTHNAFRPINFTSIAIPASIQSKYAAKITEKFSEGTIKIENLHSPGDGKPRCGFKLDKKIRVLCTTKAIKSSPGEPEKTCLVVIEVMENHKYDSAPAMQPGGADKVYDSLEAILEKQDAAAATNDPRIHPINLSARESADGKIIIYNKLQEVAVESFTEDTTEPRENIECKVLNGLAGSGKTIVTLDGLSQVAIKGKRKAIYIAKSKKLLKQAEDFLGKDLTSKVRHDDRAEEGLDAEEQDDTDAGNVQLLTYNNVIARHLFRHFEAFAKANKLIEADPENVAFASLKDHLVEIYSENLESEEPFHSYIKGYLKETLYGLKEFVDWLNFAKNKVFRKKLGEEISPKDLYYELQKGCLRDIGKKGSLFGELHQKLIPEIFDAYIRHLNLHDKIDPSFALEQELRDVPKKEGKANSDSEQDDENGSVVVIDEAQNFSPLEIITLLKQFGPDDTVVFCRDGNQSVVDPFCLTLQAIHQVTGIAPEILNLDASYRNSKEVSKFANNFLRLKANFIGGQLHRADSKARSDDDLELKSASDIEGSVEFVDLKTNAEKLEKLKGYSDDITECVVIAFREEDRVKAQEIFGKTAMILLPEEVIGLGFKRVILFEPLNSSLGEVKSWPTAEDIKGEVPKNYPKDGKNIKYAKAFNEVFVAATRSLDELYIVSSLSEKKISAQDFYKVLLESSQDKPKKTKEEAGSSESSDSGDEKDKSEGHKTLSLSKLMEFIEDNKYSFEEKSILLRYLNTAIEKILEDTEHSDKDKAQYLTQLLEIMKANELGEDSLFQKISDNLKAKTQRIAEESKEREEQEQKKQAESNNGPNPEIKNQEKETDNPYSKEKALEQSESKAPLDYQQKTEEIKQFIRSGYLKGLRSTIAQIDNPNYVAANIKDWVDTASTNGKAEIVKYLISIVEKEGTEKTNALCKFAFLRACQNGHLPVVKVLTSLKWKPDSQLSTAAFNIAWRAGKLSIVEYIFKSADLSTKKILIENVRTDEKIIGYIFDELIPDDETKFELCKAPLTYASEQGELKVVKYFIHGLVCKTKYSEIHEMALKTACDHEQVEVINCVVGNMGNKETVNKLCTGPLIAAAQEGKPRSVKGIIDSIKVSKESVKKTRDLKFKLSEKALEAAVQNGNLEVVESLVSAMETQEDKEALQSKGLKLAVRHSQMLIIKELFTDLERDLIAKVFMCAELLEIAAEEQNLEIVQYLDKVWPKSNDQPSMLRYLIEGEKIKTIKALANIEGYDLNSRDDEGKTLLHHAAEEDKLTIVKCLTGFKTCELNAKDNNNTTPLHQAASAGHLAVVQHLTSLDRCELNARDNKGQTPLHVVAQFGKLEVVKYLHSLPECKIDVRDSLENTVLHIAAAEGNLEIVEYLINLDKGDLNAENRNGLTPLHSAAANYSLDDTNHGNLEVVKYLTNVTGCELEAKDNNGCTPLHHAVKSGKLEVVKYLTSLEKCDLKARSNAGLTSLDYAASENHLEVMGYLLDQEQIRTTGNNTLSQIEWAVKTKNLPVIKCLLASDISFLGVDKIKQLAAALMTQAENDISFITSLLDEEQGIETNHQFGLVQNLLISAVKKENLELVKICVDLWNSKIDIGLPVLPWAVCSNQQEAVVMYVSKHFPESLNQTSDEGKMALHLAAEAGKLELVKYLASLPGCDLGVKDKKGKTALDRALENSHQLVAECLTEAEAQRIRDAQEVHEIFDVEAAQGANEGALEEHKVVDLPPQEQPEQMGLLGSH